MGDMLNVYMKEQNLTTELRRQIEEFYHIEHKLNNYQVDEAEMLRELPDRLKRELSLAISKRILGNVPLFEGMSSSFVRTVGLSMERRVYPQGEYVIREGQEVNQFYILTAGRAYLMQQDMVIGALLNGDYFGSIPIQYINTKSTKSTYSVRTLEWAEVRSLSISRFRQLIVEFPDSRNILIQRIVDNILQQNNDHILDKDNKSRSISMSPNSLKYQKKDIEMELMDRNKLVRIVENALCLQNDGNMNSNKISNRRESLIPELKNEYTASSILKDLKKYEIENNASITKENEMKSKINDELRNFDCLITLLSLMMDIKKEEEDEKKLNEELLSFMKSIEDRALLPKITRLRKVIQYFFIANKYEKNQSFNFEPEEIENKEDEVDQDEIIQFNMNSFFRPFIFIESQESLKSMIQNSFSGNNVKSNHVEANHIELTNKIFYHHQNVHYDESVELIFFKLGYKPTFSNSNNLGTDIAHNFFDIVIIDNDNIIQIENTLKLISTPKVKSGINLLFLVSNNLNYNHLLRISKKYEVQIILRKPLIFQDLHRLFNDIGLLMFD